MQFVLFCGGLMGAVIVDLSISGYSCPCSSQSMMSMKIFPEKISMCVNRLSKEDTLSLARVASSSTHGIGQPISDQNKEVDSPAAGFWAFGCGLITTLSFLNLWLKCNGPWGHFSLHKYVNQMCIINYLLSACVSTICCLCIHLPMYRSSIYLASIHHLPSIYLYSYLPASITYLTTYTSPVCLYNRCHLCTYLPSHPCD